ncbi:MAG: TetR/AcrR family transcriptional regulator [Proteobacteria bacterium]|nr:TetR/AcrR family transcriptional regulator [Pseudomonadota bacterium]
MTTPARDLVLAAAARLYAEHGFRGTTTRRIAEEAGVNEVTLFRHFGSKTALLLEAIRAHGLANSDALILPATPVDPVAELTAFAVAKRKTLHAMRAMIRKAMAEFEENPEMPRCMTHSAAATHAALQGYFERLAEAGFIPSAADGTAATAMLMSALFHDALGRDINPHAFPHPANSAPATYARLCLQSLGYDAAASTKRSKPARHRAS